MGNRIFFRAKDKDAAPFRSTGGRLKKAWTLVQASRLMRLVEGGALKVFVGKTGCLATLVFVCNLTAFQVMQYHCRTAWSIKWLCENAQLQESAALPVFILLAAAYALTYNALALDRPAYSRSVNRWMVAVGVVVVFGMFISFGTDYIEQPRPLKIADLLKQAISYVLKITINGYGVNVLMFMASAPLATNIFSFIDRSLKADALEK